LLNDHAKPVNNKQQAMVCSYSFHDPIHPSLPYNKNLCEFTHMYIYKNVQAYTYRFMFLNLSLWSTALLE